MLNYLNTHPEEFTRVDIPALVALMQLTGGLLAEITNLLMLATRSTIEDCLTFYVAFHVLAKIADIYMHCFKHSHTFNKIISAPFQFKKHHESIEWEERTFGHKCLRVAIKVFEYVFHCFYFYYLPFVINLIPFLAPAAPTTQAVAEAH